MASGESLNDWGPMQAEFPTSNWATIDLRNNHPVLDFDKDTDETVYFTGVLRRNYAGGGINVKLHWSATGITTGNVVWNVDFERIGAGSQDTDADGFTGSPGTATEAVPGTDGHVKVTTIARTDGAQIDSIAVGELFRISVVRDANNASDTAAADAELHAVELVEV